MNKEARLRMLLAYEFSELKDTYGILAEAQVGIPSPLQKVKE